MPRTCCVPNCRGNYADDIEKNGKVSVFYFPKNENTKKQWLKIFHVKIGGQVNHLPYASGTFVKMILERMPFQMGYLLLLINETKCLEVSFYYQSYIFLTTFE